MPSRARDQTGRRPILERLRARLVSDNQTQDRRNPKPRKEKCQSIPVRHPTPRYSHQTAHNGPDKRVDGHEVRQPGLDDVDLAQALVDGLITANAVVLATEAVLEDARHGDDGEAAGRGAQEDERAQDGHDGVRRACLGDDPAGFRASREGLKDGAPGELRRGLAMVDVVGI